MNKPIPMHTPRHRRHSHGFTILEMSVVLVIIALIIGAVSVGRDVYRSAVAERISTEFVQGWIIAYDRYVAQVGTVPGDDLANPTGRVQKGSATALCDTASSKDLRNAMLERGITLPAGRAEGQESRYVYQDSNGLPQELQVCFTSVINWLSRARTIPTSRASATSWSCSGSPRKWPTSSTTVSTVALTRASGACASRTGTASPPPLAARPLPTRGARTAPTPKAGNPTARPAP